MLPLRQRHPEDEIDELRERLEQAETDLIKMRADSTSAADKLMELFSKPKNEPPKYPLVRLSGFMQVDDGLFSRSPQSQATLGNIQDGIGFRRARLQAIGSLTEFTRYSIEFDFAIAGRPSFVDVWEQANLPFFGTIRIGQFRQPTTMDALTSIRHLDFLERNAVFQALDPFRRVGIMAYRVSDDEMTTLAYSAYATGFTFWNGASNVYQTMGDTRNGTQITDHGGIAAAIAARTCSTTTSPPRDVIYCTSVRATTSASLVAGEPRVSMPERLKPELFRNSSSAM